MVRAMRGVSGPGGVVAGRYELLDRIGQGAMGTVWRARDQVLVRDVAVKEVRLPDLMPARDRAILRERTLREARVSAKLSHPCVVTVHDVIEADGTPWIVMELVIARSLEQVLAEDGPLPPRRVAEMGLMLLGALASAHAAGIVHRDVKPGNVLLTRDGRAVLTDFGIAAVDGDPALTQTGMVVGTPGFCAPERIRGAPASPASDLWSLGATLYAAVEGRGPFDGHGSPMAVLASIVHSDPPPARLAGPLGAVIEALMSKDPAQRPDAARAGQLLTGAAAALGAAPGAGRSASAEPVLATAGPVSPTAGPVSAGASSVPASAGPVSAAASSVLAGAVSVPAGAGPVWAPAAGGRLGAASARTDPIGFPVSDGATAAAEPGLTTIAAPPGLLACPSAAPSAGGTGTSQFLADPGPLAAPARPGSFSAAAGPAVIPAAEPAQLPVSMGAASFPASIGAAPFPASMGAAPAPGSMGAAPFPGSMDAAPVPASMGAGPFPASIGGGAGPAGRPSAHPSAGRRVLALGLAGAVVIAGLLWWLVAGPPARGHAAGANGGAATAAGSLPAGYRWYTRPASAAGAPGFTMAAPAGWRAHHRGATTYLRNPVPGGVIGVTLAPATPGGPVWEARMLERAALARGTFTGYRRIAITPFLVRGKLAGAWRFRYRPPGAGVMEALVVVTRVTAPGTGRPYELMAAAPATSWPQTMAAFAEAARTFRPGP
jgi:eukaryotic-like serine/threonine-protein kinase